MKLGTENKNKTIFALVLAGLAVIFVAKWILTSGTSAATITPPKTSAAEEIATGQESPSKAKATNSQRSDKKTIATTWKPSLDPRLELKSLENSESIEYKGSGRNIFQMTAEPPIAIPQPQAGGLIKPGPSTSATPTVYVPPPPPPINLKFYGFETRSGSQKRIFLSQDGTVFVAKENDIIARRYKVIRINTASVEILDILSNNKQTIPMTADR